MRKLGLVLAGWFFVVAATGCGAMRDRRWGACAVGGGVLGAAIGGTAGGLSVSEYEKKPTDNGDRAAGAGGGALAGALLGTLLGHMICDPPAETPAPPPVAQVPPPPPPPPHGTKLATVGTANFDFNKAQLKPGAADALADTVRTLKQQPSIRVSVEGHTDSIGSDAYNQRLSERRAGAVKAYLVQQGIDGSRIEARGLGESHPVASNQTESGRAQNRRAEVIVQ